MTNDLGVTLSGSKPSIMRRACGLRHTCLLGVGTIRPVSFSPACLVTQLQNTVEHISNLRTSYLKWYGSYLRMAKKD